jgi:integrase
MPKAVRLPSGSYRCQVYIGKDSSGKREYLSVTKPTKKEAEYEAAKIKMHYKEISKDSSAMTLREAMDKYIASKDSILSPSTIRGYDIIKREHLQGLMDIKLNRMTNSLIQEAVNQEAKPYKDKKGNAKTPSPKSVRNIYGFLSAVLAEYYPGLRLSITLPQRKLTEQQILEPEHISTLLHAVEDTEMEIPVLLAVWLCMRSSEITGLTWDCVDFQRKTVTIKKARVRNKDNAWVEKGTKTTGSTRTINAPDYIMDKLKDAQRFSSSDHVVTIKGNCLYRRLKVILKNNGLPDIRFHDLRHTSASVMALLNIPTKYAQKRGGWSTPRTMQQIYTHTMASKRSSVDAQIDSFFSSLL